MFNLSTYGSQVLGSGDLLIKDVTSSAQHRVGLESSTHSTYVFDKSSELLQEVTRETHTSVGSTGSTSGLYTSACLGQSSTMETILEMDPGKTRIRTNETSATLSPSGLSFDSDEAAIYFGANKTFRVKFFAETPKRLVFQYLDPSNLEYVTKFSCTKT